ncbi:MAG TPA: TonB-dependent receptor [Candidatus Saccharimonadales bacterium]|nr:TonB-dependent receptor [Candidatus Saccharimonadales bacterium]
MTFLKIPLRAFLLVACLGAFTAGANAQFRAGVQGTVVDSQGAAVSGALVTLKNQETNISKQFTTDDSGVYSFTGLPPAQYVITVEKQGFKKKTIDKVAIGAEETRGVDVTLDIGAASESVTVNGDDVPLLNTTDATISGTVTADQIQKLPSLGRDVFKLLQLAPGAFGDSARTDNGGSRDLPGTEIGGTGTGDAIFKTENGGQISAGGSRTNQNNYQIDGVGVTSVSWGGTSVITPSEESVKEVKIITNNYDAENGRFAGGQVQIISANGTNDYHGSAFIKMDRPGLNAFQPWGGIQHGDPQRTNNRYNQLGGSVGGPILHNKLFAFFSYETIRNNSTNTSTGWYETPQLLTMAASGSIASHFTTFPGTVVAATSVAPSVCADINLVQGVNCNAVAGGLDIGRPLDPALFPLGTQDPSYLNNNHPGLGGDGTGSPSNLDGIPDLMFANVAGPNTLTEVQYHGRLDYNVTSRDLIAFSIYRVPVDSVAFNGPFRVSNLYNHNALNEAETALWNHTFSPTLINEVRVNAAGWRWNEITSNSQEPWGLPNANISPGDGPAIGSIIPQNFGAPGPSVFNQWTYGAKDVLTKVMNSHTLKFGAEYTRLLFVDEAPWSARPSYDFLNYWDFLNDAPALENATFDPTTGIPTSFRKDTRESIIALFVQDDWKVRPNFTVNVGMRWEYFGPTTEKNNNLATVRLGSGADLLTDLSIQKGGSNFSTSANNFGPQVGFAWSPKGLLHHDFNNRLVIRGGFGIGYSGLEEAITLNARNNPPFVSSNSTLMGSDILYGIPADIGDFNGYPSNPAGITAFDSNNLPVNGLVNVTGFPASLPTTYTMRYSLEAQYDLGHQWVATIGYQGTQSRHLTRQSNLNLVYSQDVALNPHVNDIDWYSNDANANFYSLRGELNHQFSHTFSIDAQYAFSRSRDQGSNNFAVDNYVWNPTLAWGPSDFDVKHSLKLFGVWSPVIFRGSHSWLEKIAGGWNISGILSAHTGFPWTPIYQSGTCDIIYLGGNCAAGTNGGLRPAAYLGGAGHDYSNSTFQTPGGNFPNGGAAYFTIPTFVAGPAFPNVGPIPDAPAVGRNSFMGPHYFNIDATLSKTFGLPEMKVLGSHAGIELRANFYNLFNNLNLTNMDTNISDTNFGSAQNALGGRTIEVQARFSF